MTTQEEMPVSKVTEPRLFIHALPESDAQADIDHSENMESQVDDSSRPPERPLVTPFFESESTSPPPSAPKTKQISRYFLFGGGVAIVSLLFFVGGYFSPVASILKPISKSVLPEKSEQPDPGLAFAQQFSAEFDVREKVQVFAYRDDDSDDQKDENEQGLQGATITLFAPTEDRSPIASGTTDMYGKAVLYGVKPGNYKVQFHYYPPYNAYNGGDSYSQELFQVSSDSYSQPSDANRVFPTDSLNISIAPDKPWEVAIQKYEPKNIVVGSRNDTVVFYDTDLQRQVAWMSSRETDAGSQNFWLVGKDMYFLDSAGNVKRYLYKTNSFEEVLKNPGIMRLAGFEYAMLSPGGQSLAYAINTNDGTPLNFASNNSNCSRPTVQHDSKSLFVSTNSNPDYFFQLGWLNDTDFWFAAKDQVGGIDHLYYAHCAENNRLDLRKSSIHSEPNDHFYEVIALDSTHVLAAGGFIEPDPSSTTGGILRSVRGNGVVRFESGKPDTLFFLGALKNVLMMNNDHTWLAGLGENDQISFYNVNALKNGEVREVSTTGSYWKGSAAWNGDIFYTLSARQCDGMICNTIKGFKPTDSGVEKVETLETKNENFNRLYGVIKN